MPMRTLRIQTTCRSSRSGVPRVVVARGLRDQGRAAPSTLRVRGRPHLRRLLRSRDKDVPAIPPRPRRPARRATEPRRRRHLHDKQITGTIPPEIGLLTALEGLRVLPASPTPGSARDRTSALRRTARRTWPRPPAGYVRPSAAAWLGSPRYPASPPWISGVIECQTQ